MWRLQVASSAYAPVELETKPEEAAQTDAATEVIAAIDVGTTKVCTMLGRRVSNNGVHILSYSSVPCDGLRKGNVSDVAATAKAIRRSVKDVEEATGHRIESAFIGVTGSHVSYENRRDRLSSVGEHGVITSDELRQTPHASSDSNMSDPGRRLIHAIKMSYSVDGESGIRNPTGMHSRNVEVETHLVTGRAAFISRLVQAVESAGVKVSSLVLEPLASGLAVLTREEKTQGALLVDIGGGTTDVVGFENGRICYTGAIPVGGYQFTNDIAVTFNTPYDVAESVKLEHASTELPSRNADVEIPLRVVGRDVELKVKRLDICQLARERAQELARLIKVKVEDEWDGELSEMRVVLTGGASSLPGLGSLVQRTLAIPVRHGTPEIRGDFPEELKNPAYATSVGILLWALTQQGPPPRAASNGTKADGEAGQRGPVSGLLGLIGRLMSFLGRTKNGNR